MTVSQKNTIDRITKRVERLNGNQTISVHNIVKGHVSLCIFNVRDLTDVITTTTFIDVEINTKGNVTKGFANEYTPKVETVYPYMN
tara:strand:+ start:240 stop:497 length:258 start_codon:yes stop_codon:yes gene_type:complete